MLVLALASAPVTLAEQQEQTPSQQTNTEAGNMAVAHTEAVPAYVGTDE